jgi:hypothetical protein
MDHAANPERFPHIRDSRIASDEDAVSPFFWEFLSEMTHVEPINRSI